MDEMSKPSSDLLAVFTCLRLGRQHTKETTTHNCHSSNKV